MGRKRSTNGLGTEELMIQQLCDDDERVRRKAAFGLWDEAKTNTRVGHILSHAVVSGGQKASEALVVLFDIDFKQACESLFAIIESAPDSGHPDVGKTIWAFAKLMTIRAHAPSAQRIRNTTDRLMEPIARSPGPELVRIRNVIPTIRAELAALDPGTMSAAEVDGFLGRIGEFADSLP